MNEQFSRLVGDYLVRREVKEERWKFVRDILIGAASLLTLLVAATWHTGAAASEIPLHVLDKQGVEIRLMDKPCVDEMSIALIRPNQLHRFKAIDSVWPEKDGSRKAYAGCWAALTAQEAGGEEAFLVVFSDGQSAAIPKSEFKKVRGQSGA